MLLGNDRKYSNSLMKVFSISQFLCFLNIQLRQKLTCRLLEQAKVSYQIVDSEGNSQLSQLMSLVLLGDYTSYYLAILNKIDPTPVKAIDYLKEQLKGPKLHC